VILLDTQAWLRWIIEPEKLSRSASSAIRRSVRSGGCGIAAISIWEASWLIRTGRIRTRRSARDFLGDALEASEIRSAPLTPEICILASELSDRLPRDPCDRMIVATALTLGCPLVTADEKILASRAVESIW
jgi:PIN domain nuclease of toxin-antitoxin system